MSVHFSMVNVSKSFTQADKQVKVFDHASFDFVQGQSYALMGQSGSGKSTCLHLLAGIEKTCQGKVLFAEQDVQHFLRYDSVHFFQKNIGLVFQNPCLMQELTVLENVMLKKTLHVDASSQDLFHAKQLLDEVGLLDKADAYPHMLSGGQQQRVALLRAVFVKPLFLLVDEPTGNLDKDTSCGIISLLKYYHQKYNMGLIVCTHDDIVAENMQHIVHVENKKIVKR